jgi:hypothetical protein
LALIRPPCGEKGVHTISADALHSAMHTTITILILHDSPTSKPCRAAINSLSLGIKTAKIVKGRERNQL